MIKMSLFELDHFFKELIEKNILYKVSLVNIAKHFFSKVLNENIFDKDFKYVKKKFKNLIKGKKTEKIPNTENEFYIFITKNYLHLHIEPKIKLLELFIEANEDLNEIQNNIDKLTEKLKIIMI